MKNISIIVICLLAIIFAVYSTNVMAESYPIEQNTLPMENVCDVTFSRDGNSYFVADGESVSKVSRDGRVLKKFTSGNETRYKKIAAHENFIWALDSGKKRFDQYDASGTLIRSYETPLSELVSVIRFDAYEEHLIIHGISKDDMLRIWIVDTKNNTSHRLDLEGAYCFSITQDGLLSVVSFINTDDENNNGFVNSMYSILSQELLNQSEIHAIAPTSVCYAEGNKMYYVLDNTLFSGNFTEQGNSVSMEYLPQEYYGQIKLGGYDGGVLMWNPSMSHIVYRVPEERKSKRTVLTYRGNTWLDTNKFSQENPSISVNFQETEDSTIDQLKAMMMTGDKRVDIYQLSSNSLGAYSLVENEYFMDLFESETISEDSLRWFPKIREVCTFNEKMFGYPITIFGYGLSINSRYGTSISAIRKNTWREFIASVAAISGKDAPLSANESEIMFGIINECLHVDTQDERAARSIIKEAFSIMSVLREQGCFSDNREDAVAKFQHIFSDGSPSIEEFIELPSISSGAPVFPVTITWLLINPYSENKESALLLLEYLEKERKLGEFPTFLEKDQPASLAGYEVISESFADCYEDCLESAQVLWADQLYVDFYNLNLDISNGSKTINQCTEQFFEKLKISRLEQGIK